MLNELPNDGVTVEREATARQFIKEPGERNLRYVEQNVHVLREARATTKHRRQSAENRVADPANAKNFAKDLYRRDEFSGQRVRFVGHDAIRMK